MKSGKVKKYAAGPRGPLLDHTFFMILEGVPIGATRKHLLSQAAHIAKPFEFLVFSDGMRCEHGFRPQNVKKVLNKVKKVKKVKK